GIQAALIVALRIARHAETEWPLTLMAVLSAVLLAAGVLTHYWDIWTHRTVRGISFLFVGIDALGDVFSLTSVVFQPRLDVLGMVIYATELENPDQAAERLQKMQAAVRTILECVGEDPDRSGIVDTPKRYAKAMLDFTQGYQQNVGDIVNNAIFQEGHNEMVIVKDIEIFSLCEHHLVP
ncbi:hypothetical protein BN1723_018297, partial [Verticillium longisporum]